MKIYVLSQLDSQFSARESVFREDRKIFSTFRYNVTLFSLSIMEKFDGETVRRPRGKINTFAAYSNALRIRNRLV